MKPKVVFVLGPTSVGKTFIGVNLAKKLNGEIISADSVQVYKGLDIGSAKVKKEEMQGVVHYAIDILDPKEEFSVYEFVEYTKNKINDIVSRGKMPIIVGGTGLYVKALTQGFNFGGTDKDQVLREKYQQLAQEKGNDYLYELLKEKDEKLSLKTDKHNTVRLIRALEIAENLGLKEQNEVEFDFLIVALNKDRAKLYEDINKRVDIMLEEGLLEEVKTLKEMGLSEENQSMRAIGYKEVLKYLNGEYDYDEMVQILKQHSRNFAKRQLTFLRGMQNVNYID
ncbi:MAG: tRNA (adenosine(37)-N6)-dimethylallyltransferase MiaA, partial [Clostridia bacterium]|nr:tRNA (adenosine(37)-N6)-dimethylallyltransferase MiaA [Clostridia bacterium]